MLCIGLLDALKFSIKAQLDLFNFTLLHSYLLYFLTLLVAPNCFRPYYMLDTLYFKYYILIHYLLFD